ncbi:MAG: OsmC family protein [Thermoprotei archaeon]
MAKIEIPPVSVRAYTKPGGNVGVRARNVEYELSELPQFGGRGDHLTPLESFIASLLGCEIFMMKILGEQALGISEFEVEAQASAKFEIGHGLKSLSISFRVKGLNSEEFEELLKLVEKQCPIYNTLKRADVSISVTYEIVQ